MYRRYRRLFQSRPGARTIPSQDIGQRRDAPDAASSHGMPEKGTRGDGSGGGQPKGIDLENERRAGGGGAHCRARGRGCTGLFLRLRCTCSGCTSSVHRSRGGLGCLRRARGRRQGRLTLSLVDNNTTAGSSRYQTRRAPLVAARCSVVWSRRADGPRCSGRRGPLPLRGITDASVARLCRLPGVPAHHATAEEAAATAVEAKAETEAEAAVAAATSASPAAETHARAGMGTAVGDRHILNVATAGDAPEGHATKRQA